MSETPSAQPARPLPWILLGIASGLLLSFAGIGLLKGGVEERPMATAPSVAPQPPAAAPAAAAPVEARSAEAESQRAMYAAQLAEAEAEWALQLEAARSGSEEARRQAVEALNQLHQERVANERQRPAAATAQASPAGEAAREPSVSSVFTRARSSEVALALGPFLEPGHAQLDNSFSAAPLPFSYAELIATGALEPEPEGWSTLYKIASNRRDRARTRWPAEPSAADLAAAQRAQEILVELGPAFVQLGMLRP